MKKLLIASGVAVLALTSVVSAQTFSTNLTVGSTGSDVVALQTWLVANGFNIPAISSGATAKGYFGSQTAAAVKLYQASKGIPNTGFVGPLTRAALNAGGSVVMTPVTTACPAGFTCTPVAGTVVTPVNTNPGSITTPGIAGTLAVSLQSTPSNGTSVDKGQTADVARYKLQAGASDMALTSLSLDFDNRFWLYATSITIKDDSGAVVAQKSGLTQNDFTELTVGSSYRLYVPVSNYVVARAATRYLTVSVSMLPVTDRGAGTLSITAASVRSVDGTGVTDTQPAAGGARSFSFTGSNNGQLIITTNEYSPPNMLVQISTSAKTENVPLGVADFRMQGTGGKLRSLTLYFNTNVDSSGISANTIFSDYKIKIGDSKVYSANSSDWSTAGSLLTFTNLDIDLPRDQKVPIAILVDVNRDVGGSLSGISASTTLVATGSAGGTSNNPVVEDTSFATMDVNDAPILSSDISFSSSNATIDSLATVVTSQATAQSGILKSLGYDFTFTLVAGDNTLYISSDPYKLFATSTTGFGSEASTTWSGGASAITANPSNLAGDDLVTNKVLVIPAGSSRKFTVSGRSDNTNGNGSGKVVAVTAIKYGTTPTNATASNVVYYNIGTFKVVY